MNHRVEVRKQVFSKIFRWHAPHGHTETPSKVEVVGTFTDWKAVPMSREVTGGWNLTLNEIPGNRTHHYMVLADDKPVSDRYSDGLAVPQNEEEHKFAISTVRGPRVFMLFAQTK